MTDNCDFLIVGGGIAGTSAAYELAAHGRAILLEREGMPGYHTTGRSAAFFTENYGNRVIRGLTIASREFLAQPAGGFTPEPMLTAGGIVAIARPDQQAKFETEMAEARKLTEIEQITADEAVELVPVLNRDYFAYAFFEPQAMYMDVDQIHTGFLRGLAARGGRLVTDAEVSGLARRSGGWEVETAAGRFSAGVVVNAAGAWADEIARLAGLPPVGLVPKRRTAIIFAAPPGKAMGSGAPMVIDVDEQFYFKPEAGKFLGSPADETPSPPCDAQPEELDIATAVDRIERAITFKITRIEHSWAGLRSFVADRSPVLGLDPAASGFCWLAGQGGYGIMTSPAMARAAAAIVTGSEWPRDLAALGVTPEMLSPRRPALTV